MGAAMALYSATACALGRYGNGNPYPISLRAVVGLSGWLPGSRYGILQDYFSKEVTCKRFHVMFSTSLTCKHEISFLLGRGLKNKIEVSSEAARRAASLPILLSHGTCKCLMSRLSKYCNLLHLTVQRLCRQALTFSVLCLT